MDSPYRRVNVMILEDQYQTLAQQGLNVSGLVRDLLGDYLSQNVINVQVSEKTREIYDTVVSNTGSTDEEIEVHLRAALAEMLRDRIEDLKGLHEKLRVEAESQGTGD